MLSHIKFIWFSNSLDEEVFDSEIALKEEVFESALFKKFSKLARIDDF